ncbi:germination protein YpeB [Fervidibacillus halotolerans]|uniref:Germination protein YpeB n=1 Tax=Fervidibacillus halotolerans TaxID=2980027 RepID=A0A9E8M1G8_9BACI|nr:germination protein YpeB [Fervidibacillus halotolerans]WAA13778.1 germination protein YpeB [Fervidibacillus halotolerans]
MIRNLLIGLLSVAIIGTGIWGYQEHKEKNAILIHAENNYQRAFHDLTYTIDLLHDKIGTTLAMNSRQSLSPALVDVWRLTSEAHSHVGQLPLTLLPFNKTEEFLSNIGEFSYRAAVRDLEKSPLSDEEYETLKSLYEQSKEIQDELRKVQHAVLSNQLRWMDVEMALATEEENVDNTIIDGFKTVEKKVEGYSEGDLGTIFTGMNKKEEGFQNLPGKEISKEEALEIAKKYTTNIKDPETKVTESGKGSDYEFYSVSIRDGKNEIDMDITKKGGYPIWVMNHREVKEQKISLNEAGNRALAFLKERKFENMKMFESYQYDHVGVFTFVTSINNVRIYPEAVKIKVALDDGTIIGFSAEEYLATHNERSIPDPVITEEEAKEQVNPNVKIMESRLAIINNELNEEVLCYEFLGTLGNDTYRIFINALNQREEKIEKLKSAEPIYEEIT